MNAKAFAALTEDQLTTEIRFWERARQEAYAVGMLAALRKEWAKRMAA